LIAVDRDDGKVRSGIAQNAQALGIAADSAYFRAGMQALAAGDIATALSNNCFGRVGGGGFIGELTDNGLLSPASVFDTALNAAFEQAIQRAAAINRGRN
jgi:hypothetical protein